MNSSSLGLDKNEMVGKLEDYADQVSDDDRDVPLTNWLNHSSFAIQKAIFHPLQGSVWCQPSLKMESECGSNGQNREITWMHHGDVDGSLPHFLSYSTFWDSLEVQVPS